MAASIDHMPKQAKSLLSGPGKVAVYKATGGPVTAQFSAHNLTLIPPISAGSIIHDNASGSGTVSLAILTSPNAPPDLKLHATDVDQLFLDDLSSHAKQESLPIEVSNQPMENLSFADDFFTHSITNIGIIFASSSGLDGAREIHRTLQPNGIAVVNCWKEITWLQPFMRARA
jgi:ubiquinone/menaquinone biosynthesis C-methylase UbiE